MILYPTKQTAERFGLDTVDQLTGTLRVVSEAVVTRDTGDGLREWGLKLFYFGGRKCLQAVNFASKFTVFMFDLKKKDKTDLGGWIWHYLNLLYEHDPEMLACLEQMVLDDGFAVAMPLKDKKIIARLNHTQTDFAWGGERFWDFIEGKVLKTVEINRHFNFNYPIKCTEDGQYAFTGEYFRELVVARYGKQASAEKQRSAAKKNKHVH